MLRGAFTLFIKFTTYQKKKKKSFQLRTQTFLVFVSISSVLVNTNFSSKLVKPAG